MYWLPMLFTTLTFNLDHIDQLLSFVSFYILTGLKHSNDVGHKTLDVLLNHATNQLYVAGSGQNKIEM